MIDRAYALLAKWWAAMPVAAHSQLPYSKHIRDGVAILTDGLRVTDGVVLEAFILHPVLQADVDYLRGVEFLLAAGRDDGVDQSVVLLLLSEYRKTANAYLPLHTPRNPVVSVDPRVNLMLVADKVQNWSDLMEYNSTHPRYSELRTYFGNWLSALRGSFQGNDPVVAEFICDFLAASPLRPKSVPYDL